MKKAMGLNKMCLQGHSNQLSKLGSWNLEDVANTWLLKTKLDLPLIFIFFKKHMEPHPLKVLKLGLIL